VVLALGHVDAEDEEVDRERHPRFRQQDRGDPEVGEHVREHLVDLDEFVGRTEREYDDTGEDQHYTDQFHEGDRPDEGHADGEQPRYPGESQLERGPGTGVEHLVEQRWLRPEEHRLARLGGRRGTGENEQPEPVQRQQPRAGLFERLPEPVERVPLDELEGPRDVQVEHAEQRGDDEPRLCPVAGRRREPLLDRRVFETDDALPEVRRD